MRYKKSKELIAVEILLKKKQKKQKSKSKTKKPSASKKIKEATPASPHHFDWEKRKY